MHKFIIALTMAIPLNAYSAQEADNIQKCSEVSEVALTVMAYRQQGLSLSETFKKIKGMNREELARELAVDSYKRSIVRFTPDERRRAAKEYSSQVMIECLETPEHW